MLTLSISLASLIVRPSASPSAVLRRARPLAACAAATTVNLGGLRKEADRQLSRAYKKTQKANNRASECLRKQDALLADDGASLEELEALPNCEELQELANVEAERLARCACHTQPTVAHVLEPSHLTSEATPRVAQAARARRRSVERQEHRRHLVCCTGHGG